MIVPETQRKLILKVIYGSKAFGLDLPESDTDTRTVWAAPLKAVLAVRPPKEFLVSKDSVLQEDRSDDELARFFYLAAKGNPERIFGLSCPVMDEHVVWGPFLRGLQRHFVSMKMLQAMWGFAFNQLRRGHGIRESSWSKPKSVAHNLRLSYQGILLAETGEVVVKLPREILDRIMLVRTEQMGFNEGLAWANEMTDKLKLAIDKKPLPEEPNMGMLNDALFRMRLAMHLGREKGNG